MRAPSLDLQKLPWVLLFVKPSSSVVLFFPVFPVIFSCSTNNRFLLLIVKELPINISSFTFFIPPTKSLCFSPMNNQAFLPPDSIAYITANDSWLLAPCGDLACGPGSFLVLLPCGQEVCTQCQYSTHRGVFALLTCASAQVCGPAGERISSRTSSQAKWHLGQMSGNSCTLQALRLRNPMVKTNQIKTKCSKCNIFSMNLNKETTPCH